MSTIKSSFHGKILEIPGIYADNFTNPEEKNARAYFLSHTHLDHTEGLYEFSLLNVLDKMKTNIYMTEASAAIVRDEARYKEIMNYIKILPLGTSTLTIPPTNENETELILDVTLIPAGHSFGSVMFLFRTYQKTILYTGDFRIRPNDIPKYKFLHESNGDKVKIDKMYVDTTFIEDKFKDFAKRSESTLGLLEEIRKWLDMNKNNMVALHTSAKYGYEYIYNEIYKKLGFKVYVTYARWRFYEAIKNLVPGVTNDIDEARIHICSNRSENYKHVKCFPKNLYNLNFLFIHLSATKWIEFSVEDCGLNYIGKNKIDICFATHCSRNELRYFVDYFSPTHIEGFPNSYISDDVTNSTRNELLCTPSKMTSTSNSNSKIYGKVRKIVDKDIVNKIFL